jgi:hypothetical protein
MLELHKKFVVSDRSQVDYKNNKIKSSLWEIVAKNLKTIDGKAVGGGKGRNKSYLKGTKSGSKAESSAMSLNRDQMLKIFSLSIISIQKKIVLLFSQFCCKFFF